MSDLRLPDWRRILAVVAHPDDESFGLGAVLSTFIEAGAHVSVLCLTRGEASTAHEVKGDLSEIRVQELSAAANELGITDVHLGSFPDGRLTDNTVEDLMAYANVFVKRTELDGVLCFDSTGVTGHPDHVRATEVAIGLAKELSIGALGWTIPQWVADTLNREFGSSMDGRDDDEVDMVVTVNRAAQLRAVERHPSQLVPGGLLWRRLALLDETEYLLWLALPPSDRDRLNVNQGSRGKSTT